MSAEEVVKSSADELRSLLDEAEQVLSDSSAAADDKVRELRDRLRSALNEGRTRFVQARESAREHLQQADTYVRENPYYAIGAAALVGALVGLAFSRRS